MNFCTIFKAREHFYKFFFVTSKSHIEMLTIFTLL